MSNNSILWYNTIRMKVVSVVIISCVVILGALSTYNMVSQQSSLENDLNKLSQVTTQRLSQHLIGPMWDLNKELVTEVLKAEMLEEKIQAITVWDKETNELFTASERGPDGKPRSSNGSINGDLIKASSLINNGTDDIGEVTVFVSKKELNDQLQASLINGFVTLILLILLMAVSITLVINHLILTPIKRLAKHADDISHGDLKQDIKPESNDEIGQLAEAFQRMQFSMRAAFKRLQAQAQAKTS
jgi:two-component system, sensor histidine kinase and response regulator